MGQTKLQNAFLGERMLRQTYKVTVTERDKGRKKKREKEKDGLSTTTTKDSIV